MSNSELQCVRMCWTMCARGQNTQNTQWAQGKTIGDTLFGTRMFWLLLYIFSLQFSSLVFWVSFSDAQRRRGFSDWGLRLHVGLAHLPGGHRSAGPFLVFCRPVGRSQVGAPVNWKRTPTDQKVVIFCLWGWNRCIQALTMRNLKIQRWRLTSCGLSRFCRRLHSGGYHCCTVFSHQSWLVMWRQKRHFSASKLWDRHQRCFRTRPFCDFAPWAKCSKVLMSPPGEVLRHQYCFTIKLQTTVGISIVWWCLMLARNFIFGRTFSAVLWHCKANRPHLDCWRFDAALTNEMVMKRPRLRMASSTRLVDGAEWFQVLACRWDRCVRSFLVTRCVISLTCRIRHWEWSSLRYTCFIPFCQPLRDQINFDERRFLNSRCFGISTC